MTRYIRWFEELRLEDVPLVGGKNASLGEMTASLPLKASECRMASPLLPRPSAKP